MNLIFDLDGTIGNTLPLCIKAFRKSIEPLINRKLSDQEIIESFGPSEEGTIKVLAPDFYNEAIERYIDWYKKLHVEYPKPFDGIIDILNHLRNKGIYLGMVTGKGPKSTTITLERYGLLQHFDDIKTGSPTGPVKPERIEEMIASGKGSKESYLYIGDSPSDVDACRRVGIKVVGAAWAETTDQEKLKEKNPDYFFSSVSDFNEFLNTELM